MTLHKKPMAVVLASGGMDSSVTIAVASQEFTPALLHVTYGQRTQQRELLAFHATADYYGVDERLVVGIEHLSAIGGSALTDTRIDVPTTGIEKEKTLERGKKNAEEVEVEVGVEKEETIPVTYVPFRNAHFLCIAVSWAEVLGAEAIFIGAVEEDSSGYPDCRDSFFRAFEAAVDMGTKPETKIKLITPLIEKSKAEIVLLGHTLAAPLSLSWSCYKNEDRACGECDSCLIRLRGFAQAGLTDDIPYAKTPEVLT